MSWVAWGEPHSGEVCRALPIKLQYDGPIDDGKAQQPDPAESDTAEHTGLEVEDEHLMAEGQKQPLSAVPPATLHPRPATPMTNLPGSPTVEASHFPFAELQLTYREG